MLLSSDTKFLSHPVFKDLDQLIQLYDHLSFCSNSHVNVPSKVVLNFASYIYSSMQGTLESIKCLLEKEHISDALLLCRKFFDDILVDVFVDVKCKNEAKFSNSFHVKDLDSWMTAGYRIPSVKVILKKLKEDSLTKNLSSLIDWDESMAKVRRFLDDTVHCNKYVSFLYNSKGMYLEHREEYLEEIRLIIRQLVKIHLSFLFCLNPLYFVYLDDYIDCLDQGIECQPIEELYLMPFAKEAFENYISDDKKIAEYVKSNVPFDWK